MNGNSTLIFLITGLLAFARLLSDGCAASETASYDTRVKYAVGKKIEFPNFTIEYVKERRQSSPAYPRGFLYYDFKINSGTTEKTVSWTAGTGDIGPIEFEIGGKRYRLELRRSDKFGKLNDNELVISQAN